MTQLYPAQPNLLLTNDNLLQSTNRRPNLGIIKPTAIYMSMMVQNGFH